jgi:7-cyano-7-deazaguanine synthase in queuosine biosynthesis
MDRTVLLSGGIDSAAAAILTKPDTALFVGYGQPAEAMEAAASLTVARQLGIEWVCVDAPHLAADEQGIYPARNLLLIATAAAMGSKEIVIGCAGADHLLFPDCRPDYLQRIGPLLAPWGATLVAPLLHETRAVAVQLANGVHGTWSCYTAGPEPCGECLSCTQ